MATRYYPARIVADDGSFMFQCIDIPGVISAGDTPDDAFAHGVEALQMVVETWDEKQDGPLPDPSPLNTAQAQLSAEDREGLVAVVFAPAILPESSVKISVTLPGDLLKRIDAVAGPYGRSGFLADAARDRLVAAHGPVPVFDLKDNKLTPRAEQAPSPTNKKALTLFGQYRAAARGTPATLLSPGIKLKLKQKTK